MTEDRVGRLYRCKITDSAGNVLYSQPGRICLDTAAILSQPEDYAGRLGDTARFSVTARGSGLTYQWQVSTNGGSSWGNSSAGGYSTNSMWVYVTESNPRLSLPLQGDRQRG